MANYFIMAGVFGLRISTSFVLQWVLYIAWTFYLLQTLEANIPAIRREGDIYIGIAADINSNTAGDKQKPSLVLKVCITDNGLRRFRRSVPQIIHILTRKGPRCDVSQIKNTTFSGRFSTNHRHNIPSIDGHIFIMPGDYRLVSKELDFSILELFIANTSFCCCHYTATIDDVEKGKSLMPSRLSHNSSMEATACHIVVAANTMSTLISLELFFPHHSARARFCLVKWSFLTVDLKFRPMNMKWIDFCAIRCRLASLVPTGFIDKSEWRRYNAINVSIRELPIAYRYRRSRVTRALLVGLNISETKSSAGNFTFDNYAWARWLLLATAVFLQFFVPVFHLLTNTGSGGAFRILSLYAFLSFFAWLSFYTCCTIVVCYDYGQVMHDLSVFCNILLPICYLILIGESCVSTELCSITNTLEDMSITEYIEGLRKALPGRYCTVKCYNYGWFHKRVLCFKESKLFTVEYSVDLSDDPPSETGGMTRVRLSMDIDFGDEETAEKYREVELEALRANCRFGSHVSVTHHDFIPGFHDIVCGYSDRGQRPYWMNPLFYVLISILGLSWPYRLIFWLAVETRDYTIKKLIYSSFPRTERIVNETASNTASARSIDRQSKELESPCASLQTLNKPVRDNGSLKASLDDTVFYIPSKLDTGRRAIFIQRI